MDKTIIVQQPYMSLVLRRTSPKEIPWWVEAKVQVHQTYGT